jgi:N-methylhydantoinase B
VRAAVNLVSCNKNHHFITGGIVNFFFSIDPHIPLNKGILRPFRVSTPPGSLVNATYPAAVGVRFATAVRILEVLMATLSMACDGEAPADGVSGIVPAAGSGLLGVTLLSLLDERTGTQKVNVIQPLWGGSGARPTKDGLDGADFPAGYLRNIPIESIEAEMPILVHHYQLASDPPAPGQWRGGLGIDLQLQVFTPNTVMTSRGMERGVFRPWGRKGGAAGSLCRTVLNPATPAEDPIGKIDVLKLQPGDVVQIVTAGGGGYGDPLERAPALVLRDVRDGYLTEAQAQTDYGVVVRDEAVVEAATAQARAARRAPNGWGSAFDLGPERAAYERAYPERLQDLVVEAISQFPIPLRQYFRSRVHHYILENGCEPAGIDAAALQRILDTIRQAMKSDLFAAG